MVVALKELTGGRAGRDRALVPLVLQQGAKTEGEQVNAQMGMGTRQGLG